MDDELTVHTRRGDLCVWVCLPGSQGQPTACRFDGGSDGATGSMPRRHRSIMRALLADAMEQLDAMEPGR